MGSYDGIIVYDQPNIGAETYLRIGTDNLRFMTATGLVYANGPPGALVRADIRNAWCPTQYAPARGLWFCVGVWADSCSLETRQIRWRHDWRFSPWARSSAFSQLGVLDAVCGRSLFFSPSASRLQRAVGAIGGNARHETRFEGRGLPSTHSRIETSAPDTMSPHSRGLAFCEACEHSAGIDNRPRKIAIE